MSLRKWFPKNKEHTIITHNYKYIIGVYSHETYGDNCLRVTKYKLDDTYVGHFVLVDGDWDILKAMLIVGEGKNEK